MPSPMARSKRTPAVCSTVLPDGTRCTRSAERGDLCMPHYHQNRRGGPLREPRTARGEGDRVDVRMPTELRQAALKDAKVEGVDEPEWWRRAGQEHLARRKDAPPAPLVKVPARGYLAARDRMRQRTRGDARHRDPAEAAPRTRGGGEYSHPVPTTQGRRKPPGAEN